jgi:type IV secretory pathway VirB2 component (pilin)
MNKPKPIVLLGAAAVAAIGALSFPHPSAGQAPGDEQAIAQVVTEIAGQQAKILTNQQVIDQKVATIEESLRVARIYVSRGGGKK